MGRPVENVASQVELQTLHERMETMEVAQKRGPNMGYFSDVEEEVSSEE